MTADFVSETIYFISGVDEGKYSLLFQHINLGSVVVLFENLLDVVNQCELILIEAFSKFESKIFVREKLHQISLLHRHKLNITDKLQSLVEVVAQKHSTKKTFDAIGEVFTCALQKLFTVNR